MRIASMATASLNDAWVTSKRNGLVSSSPFVNNGAKLCVDCDRWRDDDELVVIGHVDDVVFVFWWLLTDGTKPPLLSEWFNWFEFICGVDDDVMVVVVLLRHVLELFVFVLFEDVEAVDTEEPLNAHDADISRRSPGRKFGHAFGFNCNMLSFLLQKRISYINHKVNKTENSIYFTFWGLFTRSYNSYFN